MAGKIEEQYANSFVEQARQCLREGEYHKTLSLLGRAERLKPGFSGIGELLAITEVCCAAAWKCTCRLQAPRPKKPDWYRVLKVDETADNGTIRKRYRQLALLLHPDKNKNVRAEEAFKLVSEAYACLVDRNARKSFNIERSKTHCGRCYTGEPISKRRAEEQVPQDDYWKSEQERLQLFRERARARVTSLTHDIRARRSRWNADLESAREKYQNKRVDRKGMVSEDILRPLRESDIFQPGKKFQVAPDSDLMSILRGRRSLHREKPEVSQSLDGLLSRLRRDSKEDSEKFNSPSRRRQGEVVDFPDTSNQSQEREEVRPQSCELNRMFTKRFSSHTETLPARKLFKEEADHGRRHSLPFCDNRSTVTEETGVEADGDVYDEVTSSLRAGIHVETQVSEFAIPADTETMTTPTSRSGSARGHTLRGNVGRTETSGIRSEYAETTPFCCGSTRKSVLKEQRQKSEELLKTLERLRQEARSVAATLDKLKRRVDLPDAE